jgi:hypothetical protein
LLIPPQANFSTTPMQTPLSLALFWLLVATAGFLPAFVSGALTPVAASGDCDSVISLVGDSNVNPWGLGGSTCITNAVTGLTSLESFTYHLRPMQNGTQAADAYVYNSDAQAVVASVALSGLPNDTSVPTYTAVNATFPSTVKLSANTTYYLSFCINGTKTIGFYSAYNGTGDAFLFCSGETTSCLASNSAWSYFGGVLTMEVSSKACPSPSSASNLRWGSSFVAQAWAYLSFSPSLLPYVTRGTLHNFLNWPQEPIGIPFLCLLDQTERKIRGKKYCFGRAAQECRRCHPNAHVQ